ncbi:MAG: hypothetical protein WEC72_00700 [Chthoniobacterales bacterium]
MKESVMVWSALVPWLLLWWIFQRAAGLRGWSGTAVAGVAALAAVWFPWFGHPLHYWSAGLSANFSVIMAVLLAVGIFDRARGGQTLRLNDWWAAWIFGAGASVLLYPSALGLGPQNFDAYALGWPWLFWGQSLVLFGGVAVVAAGLILRGNRFGFVLLLASLGYAVGFQESTNLWDYLMGPVYGAVSLLVILGTLGRRFIRRSR